jgi:hypothetical protein
VIKEKVKGALPLVLRKILLFGKRPLRDERGKQWWVKDSIWES